jgi:hypothetical protein
MQVKWIRIDGRQVVGSSSGKVHGCREQRTPRPDRWRVENSGWPRPPISLPTTSRITLKLDT